MVVCVLLNQSKTKTRAGTADSGCAAKKTDGGSGEGMAVASLGTASGLNPQDRIEASPLSGHNHSCTQRSDQPRVSKDTPNICALAAVAPTVRFNALAILATPVFFFANDFNSRTSALVHSRLTDFFLANFGFLFSGTGLVSHNFLQSSISLDGPDVRPFEEDNSTV